jgi:hypothetical protein
MVEAKDLATFIIEAVGSDIMNPDTYLVRKRYQDTETTTGYANTAFCQALQDISDAFCNSSTVYGCRIYLKNGLYEMKQATGTDAGLVTWSSAADGDHVNVYMEGETRDGVILRDIETTPEETPTSQIFQVKCSFSINNLTLDGGGNLAGGNTVNGIRAYGQTDGSPILEAYNCRFMNMYGTNLSAGTNWSTFIVENCIFEKPTQIADQVNCELALARAGFIIVKNNFFDRTNGTYTGSGSSFTTGGAHDLLFTGNIVKRLSANAVDYGVSLETFWNHPSVNCTISNNIIDNGYVVIGQGGGAADQQAYQCWIIGNTLYQAGIKVEGPAGAGDYVKNIFVENNILLDPWEKGILVANTGGFVTVRNNTIKNSNKSGVTFNGQQQLMYLQGATDLVVENNLLYMGTGADPDLSPEGIRYGGLVNPTIRNNRIINRTANSPYFDSGGHSGTQLISRNL